MDTDPEVPEATEYGLRDAVTVVDHGSETIETLLEEAENGAHEKELVQRILDDRHSDYSVKTLLEALEGFDAMERDGRSYITNPKLNGDARNYAEKLENTAQDVLDEKTYR